MSHPKVKKYDELKYGKTYAPAQLPVTERLKRYLKTDDTSFWTGMLVGGVITFFLTSNTVKSAIVKSFAKVSDAEKQEARKDQKTADKEK